MSTSTKGDFSMMVQAGSMKHEEMMRVELNNEKAMSYGEGYSDGFSDGYDKALANIKEVAKKCAVGGNKKTESLRENDLRPAVLYMHKLTKRQQLQKIVEECDEVIQAWNDGEGDERVAEELVDVQMACETMLAMLGYTEEQRKKIRLDVIDKNSRRGYYMPPRDKYGD
jgi:NTP pyrophosphatase (non-canonical NTP hydrolase)